MSLATNISNLSTRVGTECKALRTFINGNAADLTALTTTSKANLIAAINEVATAANAASSAAAAAQTTANTADTEIGTLSGLLTAAKTSLVAAINEVHNDAVAAQTTANTADAEIGNLASLTTTATTSLVAAINELNALVSTAATINDTTSNGSSTWSSTKISSEIAAAITGIGTFRGSWSAASGAFPSGANSGDLWKVSVAGTVNGQSFSVGDNLYAEVDNASTSTFAGNWLKIDNTDSVTTVAGRTGAVTLTKSDITDFNAYVPGGTDVPIIDGGTGASTKSGAQANLGIVDTADIGSTTTNYVTTFEAALI